MWCIVCHVKAGYVIDLGERLYSCPQCQEVWSGGMVAQLGGKTAVDHYAKLEAERE